MRAFRDVRPEAKAGITNLIARIRPATDDLADVEKADEADVRMNRLFLEPVYHGAYDTATLRHFPQLQDPGLVREGDLALISAQADLAGVNHYTNLLVAADADSPFHGYRMIQVEPTPTSFDWSDTPEALSAVLRRVADEYTDLPVIVTENGATFHDYPTPDGQVHDPERVHYLEGYTGAVLEARRQGVDVVGYFCWSFLDNFEWSWGYSMRFGLVYVDFATQRRIPKDSAHWYSAFIAAQTSSRGELA
jgi:beta-glucosidase